MLNNSRVLILSQRSRVKHVSRCVFYEFEDLIASVDQATFVTPTFPHQNLSFKILKNLTDYTGAAKVFYPLLQQTTLNQKYSIFLACFQSPAEILSLSSIRNWREKCDVAVAWLDEIWLPLIPRWKNFLKLLSDFDYVFLSFRGSLGAVSSFLGQDCYLINYGVDTLKFFPGFDRPRSIDVYNIGRRSSVTHSALFEMMQQTNYFYIYDTLDPLYFKDHFEHRTLYAEKLKRSQYFIVNKAKFDHPQLSDCQEEVSPRLFEGAAAGTVLLGQPPNAQSFEANFDWTDAIIPIDIDESHIGSIIHSLNQFPERIEVIRRRNVAQSLLRHDWVYRWKYILDIVGLEPTPKMWQRQMKLEELAMSYEPEAISPSDTVSLADFSR